jgi:precorrin-2 dehydrogenase/sirohydrochlorin ferrochelatase
MQTTPIFLQVARRPCVVIGAGEAARPRIVELVHAGAEVTVVAPVLCVTVARLAADGQLRHLPRPYRRGDLDGAFLAYAATGDDAVHADVAVDARAAGVLLNVVDRPAWCDFITPAVVRRGALTLAISTGGASPALARRVRLDLEDRYGPEYAVVLELLRRLRQRLGDRGLDLAAKQELFGRLVDGPLVEYVREGRRDAIDALLAGLGADLSLAALGMDDLGGDNE